MIKEYENKIINADCLDILKKLPDKAEQRLSLVKMQGMLF